LAAKFRAVPHGIKAGVPRLFLDSVLLGVVGAGSALAFIWLLHLCQKLLLTDLAGYQPPGLPQEGGSLKQVIGPHGLWLIPLVTTVGGLLSGILVYGIAPEAEGHGTDTVVRSFHQAKGFLRARVAPLKMVASAITIGSGGSAGREGPIALIGAGFGSVYATLLHRPENERRLLILVGMAAGLSAIFRSPIGTALFAIEVLYGGLEFEGSALVYTLIGAMIAYAVNGFYVGWKPLFLISASLAPIQPLEYLWFTLLGVAAGLIATLLPIVFYGLRDLFRALPIPRFTKPALGGLGVGLLALKYPQVLGGGYAGIQDAIDGHIVVKLLAVLLFVKMLAFAFSVSSGGSGGVFAPSLFVGAMLGGAAASLFHQSATAFVVVGMAAVFGGAARIPIATMVMVMEMTGGYSLLAPAGLAVLISYVIQRWLSSYTPYRSLYEAQVPGRAQSPTHYAESVRTALSLISRRKVPRTASFTHVNLLALLDAGIPVDIPGGRQLVAGELPEETLLAGKRVHEVFPQSEAGKIDILALLNSEGVEIVDSETVLEPGQRVLGLVSPQGRDEFYQEFDPLRGTSNATRPVEARR
jgi:chloride channel protein, CIC family